MFNEPEDIEPAPYIPVSPAREHAEEIIDQYESFIEWIAIQIKLAIKGKLYNNIALKQILGRIEAPMHTQLAKARDLAKIEAEEEE